MRQHNNTCLTAIFQDNPGKLVPECLHFAFYWSKDDGPGGDNHSSKICKTPVKLSTPTNQHSTFLQAGCPFGRLMNSVRAQKGGCVNSLTNHN